MDKRLFLLIPFGIQSFFITFCGIFIYNVEVVTRLIFSISPFIYIVIAKIISDQILDVIIFYKSFLTFSSNKLSNFMIIIYLFGYCFIGTTLHINWLPFL